ncbi:MAG TPA: hypothetical protein VGC13_06105 [Longimicrobium sp.]|uniref:hypothetical protein n=1 Tax=Longimicrobium sp. TaxID=2029185 RepID=UPI002ED7977E
MRFARLSVLITTLFASSALLGACGDDPLFPDVALTTDTVTLTVPGAEAASALDLVRIQPPFVLLRRPELVRDAGEWDIALRRTGAGLTLRPYDAPGSPYRGAGLVVATQDYDRIREAPRATSAYAADPLAVSANSVYFFRSRQYPTSTGSLCVKFAKARILAMDAAAGTARVALVINDNCEDERLEDD